MTDMPFESIEDKTLMMTQFFFRDAFKIDDAFISQKACMWLRTVDNVNLLFPVMKRKYGMTYLHHLSIPQNMN